MSESIVNPQTLSGEIVLSERVVANEFIIVEIMENIRARYVRAVFELGPFVTEQGITGDVIRGTSVRSVVVWDNEAYDAVRDTWRNEDLLAAIKVILAQ
jgi:hypothetical protein